MGQRDADIGKGVCQRRMPFLRRRDVDLFGFLDKRADPIGAPPRGKRRPEPRHDIGQAVQRQGARFDGEAACRLFI